MEVSSTQASNPQLGVIADSTLLRHLVCKAVRAAGYEIAHTLSPEKVDDGLINDGSTDLWLIEIEDEDRWVDFTTHLIDTATVPVLLGDGQAPAVNDIKYPRWERRIYSKIKDLVGMPSHARATVNVEDFSAVDDTAPFLLPPELMDKKSIGEPAQYVWVLGASLGGPKAVKEFLDALPQGMPLAFVIAQHIDAGFQKTLEQVWGSHSHFEFIDPRPGNVIANGQVVVAPVEQVMRINSDSEIELVHSEWEGPYSPSIDQVMNGMLDHFGLRTGAILFSGMGNDGAIAGPRMHKAGVEVWAQTAATCGSSSMPDSAREIGCVSFSGSPRELAGHLVQHAKTFMNNSNHALT
ncbi:MAG: chemotaxis protein CheB [Gammaproteobacteria bacterium]|nr:MAG: chemotaxis protein CheB [Gammaproteobacteria bacterium]